MKRSTNDLSFKFYCSAQMYLYSVCGQVDEVDGICNEQYLKYGNHIGRDRRYDIFFRRKREIIRGKSIEVEE